jgi:hypothetical protein
MQSVISVLLVLSLIGVAGVLVVGIVGMLRGGDFNKRYGNLLMRARVATQLFAVAMFVLYFLVGRG